MIPRKIHYCWLSGEPYPRLVRKCMASWGRVLKDYELVLWDMDKAKAIGSAWVDAAIAQRKWAFAADYIRIWALHSEGGIYLDSDVEAVRDFGSLLDAPLMLGEEGGTGMVEAAVMGAEAGCAVLKKALDSFGAEITDETLPQRLDRVIGAEVKLLDASVLSPKDWRTGEMRMSGETRTIHHFAGAWLSAKERWAQRMGRAFGTWAVPCTRWVFNKLGR